MGYHVSIVQVNIGKVSVKEFGKAFTIRLYFERSERNDNINDVWFYFGSKNFVGTNTRTTFKEYG